MRQFRITILWQTSGHTDTITHVFHPDHTKSITADEFLALMTACVSQTISSCSLDAQNYFTSYLIDELQISEISDGLVQNVEEINA